MPQSAFLWRPSPTLNGAQTGPPGGAISPWKGNSAPGRQDAPPSPGASISSSPGLCWLCGDLDVLSLRPHIFISFCTNSNAALHRKPEHFVHSWSVHFKKFIWRHASSGTKYFFLVGFQVVSILATRKTKSFSLPFKVQLFPGLSSARTTELVLLHYTLNCAFIIFSNLFFFNENKAKFKSCLNIENSILKSC